MTKQSIQLIWVTSNDVKRSQNRLFATDVIIGISNELRTTFTSFFTMDLDWIWHQKPSANRDSMAESNGTVTSDKRPPRKVPPRHLVATTKDSFVDSAINVAKERKMTPAPEKEKADVTKKVQFVDMIETESSEAEEFVPAEKTIIEPKSLLEDDRNFQTKDQSDNGTDALEIAETLTCDWISKARENLIQGEKERQESETQRAWQMANANINILKRQIQDEAAQRVENKRDLVKAEAEIAILRKSLDRQDDKVRKDGLLIGRLSSELDAYKFREARFKEKHKTFKVRYNSLPKS